MSVRATSGDIRAVRKLCNGEALKARMLRSASGEALTLVMRGFQTSTDPSGDPWEPLKSREGVILVRTARMRNSFTSRPTPRGFVIGSNVTYTKYHQDGTQGRHAASTQHRAMPYAADFLQAGRLGTKRGRFISRQQAKKLGRNSIVGIKTFAITFGAGSGAIPARRMVPAGGTLTPRWQTSIDAAAKLVLDKAVKDAGGR